MTFTPFGLVLPTKTMTLNTVSYKTPQWGTELNPNNGPWGALKGIERVGQVGGVPAVLSRSSDGNRLWLFQFDLSGCYGYKLLDNNGYIGRFAFTEEGVITENISQSKNVNWWQSFCFTNGVGFPDPSVNPGIIYAVSNLSESITSPCFPQGGISCTTYMGLLNPTPVFCNGKKSYIYMPGSSCSGGDNWGAAKIVPSSPDSSRTTSEGFGSGGALQALEQNPVGYSIFHNYENNGAVWVGEDLVAVLTGTAAYNGANGTTLQIYRMYDASALPAGDEVFCAGVIKINYQLIYEVTLQNLIGSQAQNLFLLSCNGIWSDNNGTIAVALKGASNSSGGSPVYRWLIYFKFPGPVIQPILSDYTAGTVYQQYFPFMFANGTVGVFYNETTYSSVVQSNAVFTSTLNLRYTPPLRANSVFASNLTGNI